MKLSLKFCLLVATVFGVKRTVDGEECKYIYTWIFGPPKRYVMSFIEELDIDPAIPHGFIQLEGNGGVLSINFVQRPREWPEKTQFCRPMLRAAVFDFYLRTGLDISQLKLIEVSNVAKSEKEMMAACRCYVGLMVDMGFSRFTSGADTLDMMPDDIVKFCDTKRSFISFELGKGTASKLPMVDLLAIKQLDKASYLDELEVKPIQTE